ncbi:GNAT family N-acetyltransferase [Mannheimia bovis]|uniref:GNAT family N-acetyltransferase n=1 Tax=Mannheimia bovis TaxID=2770636 RepID=A0A7H1C232_9PAST|nr:GNAT family protein [Mannheimia bovis]QNS15037.1 GNAT family N-acetyltransferase [Mannheimia bovis]
MRKNQFNQLIGEEVSHFSAGEVPSLQYVEGKYCYLERLNSSRHFDDLWRVYGTDSELKNWTYLPAFFGPFGDKNTFSEFLKQQEQASDPYLLVIMDKQTQRAIGTFSLMRIDPANRVIEVGAVIYSSQLQRSRIATEAQYLLACYVFEELKYRRYEWKCDSLNERSRRAAERLGFTFEGIFRQAQVYHHRNRDTAWYSMLDSEWKTIKKRFEAWLNPDNFDEQGKQKQRLQDI